MECKTCPRRFICTTENLEEAKYQLASNIVDSWDMDAMYDFCVEQIRDMYNKDISLYCEDLLTWEERNE